MDVALLPYKQHFQDYGCNFYTLQGELPDGLTAEERYLLSTVGLPDAGLPFFHFDLFIGMLRDVRIEEGLVVLGTAFDPASGHYIYIGADHRVYTKMEDGDTILINASIRQLINCIFVYSKWLEELEDRFFFEGSYVVDNDDIFELYYKLRDIDPEALQDEAIWFQLVNTEVRFEEIMENIGE